MTPQQRRLWLDLVAARYQEAVERGDFDTMLHVSQLAATDAELLAILHEVHVGLVEEQEQAANARTVAAVTEAVTQHLPSAEIIKPTAGPLTVADVAAELFRHPPARLSAEAHGLNERLRTSTLALPDDLGLSALTTWGTTHFGDVPTDYWKAFRQAAVKLELRRSAETEYHLAARPAPKPEDRR